MNLRAIVGISLAVVFAVSMIANPIFANAPDNSLVVPVDQTSIIEKGEGNNLFVRFNTSGDLSDNSGAWGYAIETGSSTNNVLVVVTHLPIDDSRHENKKTGLHSHVLDLTSASAGCDGHDFEVDLAASEANKGFDANYKFKVKNKLNIVQFENAKINQLNSGTVSGVSAFTLTPIFDGPTLTNLCGDSF